MSQKLGKITYNGFFKIYNVQTPDGDREVVLATNAVAILIYNKRSHSFILISQYRVGVQRHILEPVAGRFDGNYGIKELCQKEIKEETGIVVSEQEIILISDHPFCVSPGLTTEKIYLAFVSVNLDTSSLIKDNLGNQNEGENISLVEIPVSDLGNYVIEDLKLLALLNWFKYTSAK